MTVLREAGMVWHLPVQPKAAEPAIGKVEMDFFAKPSFRPDAHAIAHDQHPHHQLGIDRRATCAAVERLQLRRSEERRVGKSVSVRVDFGGRRLIKKKNITKITSTKK